LSVYKLQYFVSLEFHLQKQSGTEIPHFDEGSGLEGRSFLDYTSIHYRQNQAYVCVCYVYVYVNFLLSGLPNFRKAKGRLIFLAVGKALETNHKDTNL
jgi:hypothetical protein